MSHLHSGAAMQCGDAIKGETVEFIPVRAAEDQH
jgi:hypothetical protein